MNKREATHHVGLWKSIRCFLRVEYLPFALLMPAVGVATAGVAPTAATWAWLGVCALAFHLWAMLVNDVIDLPVDRQQPGRRSYPLVRGAVSPAAVLAVAGLQLPVMAGALSAAGAGPVAWTSAGVALGVMLIYNLGSKSSRFPPLMDLAQAVPFGAMVVLGASVASPDGKVGLLTWMAALWLTGWENLTNVFGGLRDLEFDARLGLRTTPLRLGATVERGAVATTPALRRYVTTGVVGQALLSLGLLLVGATSPELSWTAALALLLHLAAASTLASVWRAAPHGCREMTRVIVVHLSLSLLPLVAILAARPSGWVAALLGGLFVLPTARFFGRTFAYLPWFGRQPAQESA